jgi:hypothetical protein
MYVTIQVHFVHYIIVTNPHIVPEFIFHPGNGGEPRVDEQSVHLLCDTSTHVFFVHFGSKCHSTLMQKTVCYATVHYKMVCYRMVRYKTVRYRMVHYRTVRYRTVRYRAVNCKQYSVTKRYRYKTVQSLKALHLTKQFVTKRYCYKTVRYKTVHRHYGRLHTSTLKSQSTGLHQPKD